MAHAKTPTIEFLPSFPMEAIATRVLLRFFPPRGLANWPSETPCVTGGCPCHFGACLAHCSHGSKKAACQVQGLTQNRIRATGQHFVPIAIQAHGQPRSHCVNALPNVQQDLISCFAKLPALSHSRSCLTCIFLNHFLADAGHLIYSICMSAAFSFACQLLLHFIVVPCMQL